LIGFALVMDWSVWVALLGLLATSGRWLLDRGRCGGGLWLLFGRCRAGVC
jgi:hypothetical protein